MFARRVPLGHVSHPPRAWRCALLLLLVTAQILGSTLLLDLARPVSAGDLFAELRSFPGVVLVPGAELQPFHRLEPWRVELNRPRAGVAPTGRGRYLIQYRDPEGGDGAIQIGGTIGRDEMDQIVTTLAGRSFQRCPADASYCAENVAGQDDAPPASEVFRGLTVGESPAIMEHVVCCGGHYWSLSWFDAARDMTYSLILVGPIADEYGTDIAVENERAAQEIAALAGWLRPLE